MGQRGAIAGRNGSVRAGPAPAYSLYLDAVRVVAALAVFLDHLCSYPFSSDTRDNPHPLLRLVDGYGNAAVIVFFVLSGFVIAYVVATRERTAGAYFVSRLSRLYSVVLPALLLTLGFDALGRALQPQFYAISTVLWAPPTWQGYLASLLFVNEFQVLHLNGAIAGSNAPFWSLSFEATYYALAGVALFLPRRYGVPLGLLVLCLAGPTVAVLLPLWALGFLLFHTRARLGAALPAPRTLAALSAAAILVLPKIPAFDAFDNFGASFPWGHGPYNRNVLLDYAIALSFAVQMLAAQRLLAGVRVWPRLGRAVRWLGATTFPMYAMHYPALCLFTALSPFAHASWAGILFVSGAVVALVAVMTPACEWLKVALRRAMTRPGVRLAMTQ